MKRPLTLLAAAVAVTAAFPSGAFAFGTVNSTQLEQRSEHERITRLALQCTDGLQAPACFQPRSLDNVAGAKGTFGAVGAADDAILHRNPLSIADPSAIANLVTGDEDYWHCDNIDYLAPADGGPKKYAQTRDTALKGLRECLNWGRAMLYDGVSTPGTGFIKWASLPPATPDWGALAQASTLVNKRGEVNTTTPSGTCTFNGSRKLGNAKCNVLEPWGYVLHMAEDFYSHTNWADKSDPAQKLSVDNPPGLGKGLAPFLDLRQSTLPTDADIPAAFTGGCFKFPEIPFFYTCDGRVAHGSSKKGINKDKELIDTATGVVSDPINPRSKITVDGVSNAQRAVDDAVAEARRQWEVFRSELISRYGLEQGTLMACVLTMDDTSQCNKRNIVAVVDTSKPASTQALAAAAGDTPALAAARDLIGDLDAQDRVSVLSFDSATGEEDADPFVAPAQAKVTRTVADPEDDPSTVDDGKPLADDPTYVAVPDATDTSQTPEDRVGNGDHETPEDMSGQPLALPAQPAAKGAPPQPDVTALPKVKAKSAATANALSSAATLLDNEGAPMGQRGIVLSTNRLGDTDALVKQIDALADAGTTVSLVLFGASAPDDVVAAIERANGVAVTLPAGSDRAAAAANAVLDAGLTRLSDPMGAGEDPALGADNAPVTGVTDPGRDTHTVAPLKDDSTLTVRSPDAPLKIVATDVKSGRSETASARPGDPAQLPLDAGGDWDVQVWGTSGNRYTATIS
jgi:hypothetical protein